MKKKILIFIAGLLICLQVIRPASNSGEAATKTDITHYVNVPPHILSILKRSCYDCHSNHTHYPWYSQVTPVNFWLQGHVEQGKKVFNFSDFSCYSKPRLVSLLRLIGHEMAKGTVPLPSYLWIHREAALSDRQVQEVVSWTQDEAEKLSAPDADAAFGTPPFAASTINRIAK